MAVFNSPKATSLSTMHYVCIQKVHKTLRLYGACFPTPKTRKKILFPPNCTSKRQTRGHCASCPGLKAPLHWLQNTASRGTESLVYTFIATTQKLHYRQKQSETTTLPSVNYYCKPLTAFRTAHLSERDEQIFATQFCSRPALFSFNPLVVGWTWAVLNYLL